MNTPQGARLGEILAVALRAGQLMMENGANAARVEVVVARFGLALGADRLDVHASPTAIIATASAGAEHGTRILRIAHTGIDLRRVAEVSALAKTLPADPDAAADPAKVRAALEAIARTPRHYGPALGVAAVGAACAAFALLFGASGRATLAAGLGAALGQALRGPLARGLPFGLLVTSLVAAGASLTALATARRLGADDTGLAMAASVLFLVPGMLMASSVADLCRGHVLSGVARAASATMVVVAIGVGLWGTLAFAPGEGLAPGEWQGPPPLAVPLAAVASLGFAVVFGVPPRALPWAAAIGSLGYAAKQFSLLAGLAVEPAVLVGSVTLALLAEVAALRLHATSNLFTIPAFIPLIPGVPAFRTVLAFVARDYVTGLALLVQTSLWIGALSVGVGMVQALTASWRRW